MSDFGIKVVKSGADTTTTDPREILMSSQYPMLKFHSDSTTSVTLNGGDTDKYAEITHDLGYVPAFIAYYSYGGRQFYIPSIPRGSSYDNYGYAWADTTKVRVGFAFASGAYNQFTYSPVSGGDFWDRRFASPNFFRWGAKDGDSRDGAVRFPSVTVAKNASISAATLDVYVEEKGSGSGNLLGSVNGIDDDNTGSFSSDPFGRSTTTAATSVNASVPSAGEYVGVNVKSQVEEITTRAGWSSGNAMGFFMYNSGSNDNVNIGDAVTVSPHSRLKVTLTGSTTVYFRVIIFKDKIA